MGVIAAVGGLLTQRQLTGNHPGYILTFHAVAADGTLIEKPGKIIHSDNYEAQIRLPLAGDLRGAESTLALIGLTDADHGDVAAKKADGTLVLGAVRVHLFWRDTNSSVGSYLTNLTGLGSLVSGLGSFSAAGGDPLAAVRVAELGITGVSRRRGSQHYETVVAASDRVSRQLTAGLREPMSTAGFDTAATRLAAAAGVPVRSYPVTATDPKVDPAAVPFTAARGERVSAALTRLARLEELASGRYGRGLLMVRDGMLHVGPRPIPFEGGDKSIDYATGLLSVEALSPVAIDTNTAAGNSGSASGDSLGAGSVAASVAGPAAAAAGAPPVGALAGSVSGESGSPVLQRDQWKLLLRGRPDIKPGDVVAFDPPPGEGTTVPSLGSALAGAFAAPLTGLVAGSVGSARGYVSGVIHTTARASGFLTELSVVALGQGDNGWDNRSAPATAAAARGGTDPGDDHPDPTVALRNEFEQTIARQMASTEIAEVGEVRAIRSAASGSRTSAQRTTLWQGTSPAASAAGGGTVGLPIDRATPLEKNNVPYATPFAWGKCGLVLPRYPGTRVLSVHRHGLSEEPVDVGAVWPDGEGPDAQAGDWWLSLPVGVAAAQRESVSPGATPTSHTGKVTNDLIDADGHRVIEVGNLRLVVGPDKLETAGTRPAAAASGVVLTIEHADGTTLLQFTDQGDIKIVAKGKLSLTGAGVSIDAGSGDVEMKGSNVKVQVQNQMSVE